MGSEEAVFILGLCGLHLCGVDDVSFLLTPLCQVLAFFSVGICLTDAAAAPFFLTPLRVFI